MDNRPPRTSRVFLAALLTGLVAVAAPAWGQVINEDLKLLATDGAAGDEFGCCIAIDGGIVAIGARSDDDNGLESGSAYLFEVSTGALLAKLLPGDGAAEGRFGECIAIDGGIVAVGAGWDGENGYAAGAAYLFDASTGVQTAKLLPNDGASGEFFGSAIAIDSGDVAVGAYLDSDNGLHSGSAYLFDASTGEQRAKLVPSDGVAGAYFGWAIAIDNGVVAVGALCDDDNGWLSGSAYLFNASTGAQIAKLLPSDGEAIDWFGHGVAINNGLVAVGAPLDDDNGDDSGSAYVFNATTGAQIVKLLPNDGAAGAFFGLSVAMSNGVVAVGAASDDSGYRSGAVYLFDPLTGTQLAKLLPSDGGTEDWFGWSLAADTGLVVAGAIWDDDGGDGAGSAYVFRVDEGNCRADLTGDGVVDSRDFLLFLGAWAHGDPLADWNDDGVIDTRDFIAYLSAWSAGC